MKKHLTDAAVASFKLPKEGQIEIFDLGYPGLALRIGHGGAKTFEHFYRDGGKLKRSTLGRWPAVTLAEARNIWRLTREAIAKGEPPQASKASTAPMFEAVAEDWLKRDQSGNKPQTFYMATRTVEADLLPAWRGKPVDQISKLDVIELLDRITDRSPSSALRVRSLVRRLFRWCIERDILMVDPTASLPRAANGKERERILNDAEMEKIWHAADGNYGALIRMLALTGARRDEIASLRWDEIDGDTITLAGARTKTGRPHTIPLSQPALDILASQPRTSEYVFAAASGKPIQLWSKLKSRIDADSGVSGWVVHDLRRTARSLMSRAGVRPDICERVIGHTIKGVEGVYDRYTYDAEKRDALTRLAELVIKLAA